MSYDLAVYVSHPAEPAELLETVTGTRDLAVDGSSSSTGDSVVVVRGVRARYCLTVGGPFRVEAEDVPYDVTAAVLGVSHMYTVMVEGSAPTDVPCAMRFARRLAQTLGGAVVDQQTDEVWSRGSARVAANPNKDQRIAEVDLRWHVQTEKLSAGSASSSLESSCPKRCPVASASTSRSSTSSPRWAAKASSPFGTLPPRCCSSQRVHRASEARCGLAQLTLIPGGSGR